MPKRHTSIADALREAIRHSGMSLTDLAAASEVHRVQLSYFVHRHQDLSLRNAGRVADALGMALTSIGNISPDRAEA